MTALRIVPIAATAAFLISHFLPAYDDGLGFDCFRFCWGMMLGKDAVILSGAWFYYTGFVLANLLFPILAITLIAKSQSSRVGRVLATLAWLQVFSWFVAASVEGSTALPMLKIGYYVWLGSFTAVMIEHYRRKLRSSPQSPSTSPLAVAPHTP